jgi:hypothetical protein
MTGRDPKTAIPSSKLVMAGLVPATPILGARPCHIYRDRWAKPGDDDASLRQPVIYAGIIAKTAAA